MIDPQDVEGIRRPEYPGGPFRDPGLVRIELGPYEWLGDRRIGQILKVAFEITYGERDLPVSAILYLFDPSDELSPIERVSRYRFTVMEAATLGACLAEECG